MLRRVWIKILRLFYKIQQKSQLQILILTKKSISQQTPLICFSHPRCATQSMGKILEAICCHKKLNLYWGYRSPNQESLNDMMSKYHLIFLHRTEPGDFPDHFKNIEFRGFHMIRDPRNVLVSMLFSHRDSHKLDQYTKSIEKDRMFLKEHNEEEGLLYLMEHSKQFNEMTESLARWDLQDPRLMTIHFEKYVDDVEGHWQTILEHLKLSVLKTRLERILSHYSFKMLQRGSRSKSGHSHYRSAQPDDYQKHFTPKVKDEFKKRHGDLMIQLGYERNLDW